MSKSKFSALMFLISGVFMAVCCFLPFKTLTIESSFESSVEPLKLFPSLGGFFVLGLSVACIVCPVVGYKKHSALFGTITSLLAGVMLWYNSMNAGSTAKAAETCDTILTSTFGSAGKTEVTVTTNFGFYLIILAAILLLITGFAYTISEDDY